jgi:hypothetical protein
MNTRKQHLQKLPLQKRLQFMEQIRKHSHLKLGEAMCEITGYLAFPMISVVIFDLTKQGHEYWMNINSKYFLDEQ